MARTSPSDKGSFLGTLIELLREVAANVILVVWVLGSLYARLFEALPGERELAETRQDVDDRQAHVSSECNKESADVFIHSKNAQIPVQVCNPSYANEAERDGFSTSVPSTPADQILFNGIGPTPQAPLAVHPVGRTLPAPSTAEPPSPSSSNLLPRNLDPMLLAVADCQDAAEGPKGYNLTNAHVWARDSVANPVCFLQDYLQEPQPVSTPPPATLTPLSCYEKLDTSVSVPTYSDAPTMPRKAPGIVEMVNASPLLTPQSRPALEDGLLFSPAVEDADGDDGDGPICDTPTASGAGAGCALESLLLEPLAHKCVDVIAQEDNTSVNAPEVTSSLNDSAIGADAVEGYDEINCGGAKAEQQQTEQQLKVTSSDIHFVSLIIPAIELPATPASSGLDELATGDGSDVAPGNLQTSFQDGYEGDEERAEEVSAVAVSPNALELPHSSGLEEQPQVQEGQPLPEDCESLQCPSKPDAGVVNTVGAPARTSGIFPKGRSTPSPKRQTRKSFDAFSASAAATPRIAARSPKVKRSVFSPNATGITTTPATARRPVGPDPTGLRSPPSGSGVKRRVVRKLSTSSPKADAAPNANSRGVIQGDGSISLGIQAGRSDRGSASGGAIPRYAAPTAASNARKAPSTSGAISPQQQPRHNSTQKLSLSTTVPSIAGEFVRGDGVFIAPDSTRKTDTDAKVRPMVSSTILNV